MIVTSLIEAEAALEPFFPSHVKRFAYTLEHVEKFMDFIGNPQNKPRSFHVAGTSGKTSTAYYTAALLKQAGKRVGLLTSPHTEFLNERVQIDLEPLAEPVFCSELSIFFDLIKRSDITLTYAEILYAFGYWVFARQKVDYIVVEVGLGGLLDATNVITREDKICVITDIGLDHTNILGNTIAEIAEQKAGIIHLHNTVFCHNQDPAAITAFRQASQQKHADLHILNQTSAPADVSFLPLFQRRNIALAYAAVDFELDRQGEPSLTSKQIDEAAHVRIPGRMELIKKGNQTIVLDGAHNPQKLQALRESMKDYFPGQPIVALVGLLATPGRKPVEQLTELAPLADHVILTMLHYGRHKTVGLAELEAAAKQAGLKSYEIIADQAQAYRALRARPEPVQLITGSIYLVGQLHALATSNE